MVQNGYIWGFNWPPELLKVIKVNWGSHFIPLGALRRLSSLLNHWPGTGGLLWAGALGSGWVWAASWAAWRAAWRDSGSLAARGSSFQRSFHHLLITHAHSLPNYVQKNVHLLWRVVKYFKSALREVQHSQWRWTSSFIHPTSCHQTSSNRMSRTAWRRQRYGETGGRQRCLRADSKPSGSNSSSLQKTDHLTKM